jgi:hypothetical protein
MYNKNMKIQENSFGIKGKVRWICTDNEGNEIRKSDWNDNVVTTITKTDILDRLNGTVTYDLIIDSLDIGTSSTAPAVGDTNLNAGVARASKVTGVRSGNTLTLSFYFTDAGLANGAYWEVGTFSDGTATLGNGRLRNHALFGTVLNKGTGENITVEVALSIV